jgi:hypothetical protein
MTRRFVGFGGASGAGSGTVTNTGGNLTANAVVLGSGVNDTKVSTGINTNGASELDLGVVGTNGVLGLVGSTSGTATLTAPAIAGTVTNPIAISNGIKVPDGAAATPSYGFAGAPTTGLHRATTNIVADIAGVAQVAFNSSSGVELPSGNFLAWSGTADPTAAVDTTLGRFANKVLNLGVAGDATGWLRSASAARVTGDITLTVNTAITVFSFAVPPGILSWGWQAVIPWVISAGSGTNTISIGVNYTQTPSGTTGTQANILTTNTGTGTQAYVALSASGATNILTSPTITPAATIFQATCSGTLLSAAAAGTFTITMTAAGTTATALAKAGATCWFY